MINLKSAIFPLFFFASFANLIYEVVWARQFAGIFGSTSDSACAVASAYLAGIAVGGFFLGRLGDRVKNRLLLFVLFETVVGIYGILSSFGFPLLAESYYSGECPIRL